MAQISAKAVKRMKSELKKYRSILSSAKQRDVHEADTSLVVAAILSDVLGYDRFLEVTSEYTIRGTYCDLAIKLNDKLKLLVEVKAIGLELRDTHLRQAIDYAAKEGIDWVILTNGVVWRAYRVVFQKPITFEEVFTVDLLEADSKDKAVLEKLYLLSKEGISKKAIAAYHEEKKATSRYMIAAILQSEALLSTLRREVRRISTGVRVSTDELKHILRSEVFKRDVLEGDQAEDAERIVRRTSPKPLRRRKRKPVLPESSSRGETTEKV